MSKNENKTRGSSNKKRVKLDLANLTLSQMDMLIEAVFEVKDYDARYSSFRVRDDKGYAAKRKIGDSDVEIFVFNPHTDMAKGNADYCFFFKGMENPYLYGNLKLY